MSRSYKHTPIIKDNKRGRKSSKTKANSKVRCCRDEDIPTRKRGWFKRASEQYNIYDYISYCSKEEIVNQLIHDWLAEEGKRVPRRTTINKNYHQRYHTLENFIQNSWHKYYKRK